MSLMELSHPFKSGYVVIVGRPNVGKSTLMNALLRQKLSIVSPKPQTTRHRILGILNGDGYQIVFLDTPGLVEPKYLLQEKMLKSARATMGEADLILAMVEAEEIHTDDENMPSLLAPYAVPKFLLINKIDLLPKDRILPVIDHYRATAAFQEIIPVSALHNDGVDLLLTQILKALPKGDPYYPPDIISDEPERFFVSEIIREQIFLQYGEEIPYSTTVQIDEFHEKQEGKDFIRAVIYVERDSQKGILIGKGGGAIKRVGSSSRESIEAFLDRPVFLALDVRVQKKWRKDPKAIRRLGYR